MKSNDQTLGRLLDAAAKATPGTPATPPLGLETRVLSHWRAKSADDDSVSVFAFLRRATLGAGLVLALCAAWSFADIGGSAPGDEAALLNYDIQMSLNP
jgi:predicted signal transduction protein with EAL and GGDEF domain